MITEVISSGHTIHLQDNCHCCLLGCYSKKSGLRFGRGFEETEEEQQSHSSSSKCKRKVVLIKFIVTIVINKLIILKRNLFYKVINYKNLFLFILLAGGIG